MKKGLNLWFLPLYERVIRVGKTNFKKELMELDGVGFVLEFDGKEEQKDPGFIRRHLVGIQDTYTYVFAKTKDEAIKIFETEFEGAKIGTKAKALWIEETEYRKIKIIAECPRRMFNEDKFEFRCGYVGATMEEFDEMPGCILENYDPPEDCPVSEQYDREYKERQQAVT